jgi:hypothetical protein
VLGVEHPRHRAHDGHHRIALGGRRHESSGKISRARSRSGDADTRNTSDSARGGGHERCVLLMAADDELDLWVVAQGVEDGIDFRAGDAEDYAHASVVEAVDDDLGDFLFGLGRHDCDVIAWQSRFGLSLPTRCGDCSVMFRVGGESPKPSSQRRSKPRVPKLQVWSYFCM